MTSVTSRATLARMWVSKTPDAIAVHHGFRSWDEGKELTLECKVLVALMRSTCGPENGRICRCSPRRFILWLDEAAGATTQRTRRSGLRRLGYFASGGCNRASHAARSRNPLYNLEEGAVVAMRLYLSPAPIPERVHPPGKWRPKPFGCTDEGLSVDTQQGAPTLTVSRLRSRECW